MEALSVSDYRNHLSASFDRADRGEQVLIRRKNQIYALMSVGQEDLTISSSLKKRIKEARKAYVAGNVVSCSTKEQLNELLNSL